MLAGLKLTGAVGLVGLLLAAGAYVKGRGDGREAEALVWQAKVDRLKVEAAAELLTETNRVLDTERRLAALSANLEAAHAARIADLDAATSKYNRLGKLFEQTRARCGGGGDAASGAASATPGVGAELSPAAGDISGAADETLGGIARDADELRLVFATCQDYVTRLPKALTP